jgi:ATP-dependent Lhr-like helicase
MSLARPDIVPSGLPEPFAGWFAARGWTPRAHQLALLATARAGQSTLLIAPTGAGKTLAGFLPTLVELTEAATRRRRASFAIRASSPSTLVGEGRGGGSGSEALPRTNSPTPASDPSPAEPRYSEVSATYESDSSRQQPTWARGGANRGLHTLYISPLKALAVDIARNLETPVAEMGLAVRIETRTGDTPASKRMRQRRYPPDILLTTPEQLALLLSTADAPYLFGTLKRIVLDELHSLVTSKRGDLLSLGLARLYRIAPGLATIGLSATVAEPDELCRYLVPQRPPPHPPPQAGEGGEREARADLLLAEGGAKPIVRMLDTAERLPWAGHSARHALGEIYELIRAHRTTLVFVNTRSQAEMLFQELWRINDESFAIALHHGSLDAAQRRKVEAAMAGGRLKAVVCTSSLDLGIDWGDVDLVVNVGAPKGASRLTQRIGRANHRLDEPSRAVLIPANRFEVLECHVAIDAVAEGAQDTPPLRTGAFDVLAQHVLGCACGEPFWPDALFEEVRTAAPFAGLTRADFDAVVDFVATGGYALRVYERFAKIRQGKDGRYRISHPRIAQQYRLNVGTIVEEPMIKVRLVRSRPARSARVPLAPAASAPDARGPTGAIARGGRVLGELEEYFVEGLTPGDTFVFSGEILRFEVLKEDEAYVSRAHAEDPKVPSYAGGKFPLSTYLAARVRALISEPRAWSALPAQVREWLATQRRRSVLPMPGELLVETFPRADKHYLVCYPFEGRLAHQTLGMLLTRRLERARLRPLGFVANEYALTVWGLGDPALAIRQGRLSLAQLFGEDMLGDDLEAWLAESALMKRMFRQCAIIAGLVERRSPREKKDQRQMTVSTDLVYDVLRRHQADHILLRAARQEAAAGLLDIKRLGAMLARIKNHVVHRALDHVSPLAVPVMLEIGRESVYGEASETLLAEAEADLVREAMR